MSQQITHASSLVTRLRLAENTRQIDEPLCSRFACRDLRPRNPSSHATLKPESSVGRPGPSGMAQVHPRDSPVRFFNDGTAIDQEVLVHVISGANPHATSNPVASACRLELWLLTDWNTEKTCKTWECLWHSLALAKANSSERNSSSSKAPLRSAVRRSVFWVPTSTPSHRRSLVRATSLLMLLAFGTIVALELDLRRHYSESTIPQTPSSEKSEQP